MTAIFPPCPVCPRCNPRGKVEESACCGVLSIRGAWHLDLRPSFVLPGGGEVGKLLRQWWRLWQCLAFAITRCSIVCAVHNPASLADRIGQPIHLQQRAGGSFRLSALQMDGRPRFLFDSLTHVVNAGRGRRWRKIWGHVPRFEVESAPCLVHNISVDKLCSHGNSALVKAWLLVSSFAPGDASQPLQPAFRMPCG